MSRKLSDGLAQTVANRPETANRDGQKSAKSV